MPVRLHPFRRFSVPCSVTYQTGPFQGQGTVRSLSCTGGRLSGNLPMRPGKPLSLIVTLPNEQRIERPEAVVKSQEFVIETVQTPKQTQAQFIHTVRRLVNNSFEVLHG